MTEAIATLRGRRLDARYTLLDKLGAGGQGEVWRAHDGTRGVDIALKVLSPSPTGNDSSWIALEHEYAITSRLDHPAILKVFPPHRAGDVIVLPMELASGGDLRRLRGAGFLEIIPALLEIAQALEHAHERGVVHRDLKPGNVLFDARGRARLADFGVAENALDTEAPSEATRDGSRHGFSPFTSSPAQLRGEPPTPADDIYGLGALAYELLSGYPPYYPHFNKKRAIEEPVPRLVPTRQIPPLLNTLVMHMLAKDPKQRPRTMREVIDDLDAALNDTLTFEFEQIPVPAAASVPPAATAFMPVTGAAQLPTIFVSDEPAANMPEGPPKAPDWTPNSGWDRRTSPDRRGRRDGDRAAPDAVSKVSPVTPAPAAAPAEPAAPIDPGTASTDSGAGVAVSTATVSSPDVAKEADTAGTLRTAASSSPVSAVANTSGRVEPSIDKPQTWREIPMHGLPRAVRLRPNRPRRWPWLLLGLVTGAAVVIHFWLPAIDQNDFSDTVTSLIAPLRTAMTPVSQAPAPQPAGAVNENGQINGDGQTNGNGQTTVPEAGAPASGGTTADSRAIPAASAATGAPGGGAAPFATNESNTSVESHLRAVRQAFDTRLAVLESRGAGVWGGRDFAMARTRAAESVGARDAGNPRMALDRLSMASRLLDSVEARAPQALSAQVAAGEKALGTGQQEVAGQAFDLARRIDPSDRRASEGQRHAQNLNGILPLLADAQNAEAAHDYARSAQDYSQALALDPDNATARAGQLRANAAFGDDSYAKAIGAGFAALGAGRLDQAHDAFVNARSLKPNGAEASEGLRRVGAALTARGFASMRQRAAGLEAQERWDEAEQAYEDVLGADPSLAFAQSGKARAASRAELSGRLQQLIDRPERLASPGAREEARSLLETAQAQSPSGPVLRSQIARLEILLPGFDKPVRLSLLSDNSTQVAIDSVGTFGAFARREIELRPGKYIVVGTRNGFRDVRREITIAPGQEIQTIKVTCSEPI